MSAYEEIEANASTGEPETPSAPRSPAPPSKERPEAPPESDAAPTLREGPGGAREDEDASSIQRPPSDS